jgi:hypothetical protein
MREINQSLQRKIKARLFMNAVLPAFEDLLEYKEQVQAGASGRNFNLRFQTSSGLKSTLIFKNKTCQFIKKGHPSSHIVLHFLTEEQLNNEFENKGFRIPIPIKGASRLADLKAFRALSAELEACLRPNEKQLEDPTFERFHVGLQLGIALRALVELTLHEPRAKRIMTDTPEGIAYFSIGAEDYGAWVEWRNGKITAGKGRPEQIPDVSVTFADAKNALRAIGNRIDVMAAIGMGNIQITGLVPLADAIGYIFERIPLYITP